ncbi:hypothetical protein SAMN06269185_1756 [Natronoarchaeum philippinense]|uniref:Uncharacterized protein n=1 Tax=Natronoarchaeum philippinense TaxID=558529 RepID=A0A285NSG3_NATPI|nr:hypothetical protein [Natronoarchaeum philippinense]SNZ12460.1 hypothetical protein SAMN06269185_1756 [Natronoarchaeum philippinense]
MERDEPSGGDEYVEARLPGALYDRVEAIFREHRGYEPTSVQECLSVVCDLAEQRQRGQSTASADAGVAPTQAAPSGGVERQPSSTEVEQADSDAEARTAAGDAETQAADSGVTEPSAELVDVIDSVFPTDWSSTEATQRLLPLVVRRYVAETDAETRAERENAALSALAAREGTTPEQLRQQLVDDVYGGSALPGDLATEFFSEALEKVERRVDAAEREMLSPSELVGTASDADAADDADSRSATAGSRQPDDNPTDADESIGLDLGPGSADLPAELADEMASDGGAVQSVDERVDNLFTGPNGLTEIGLDSMVAGARADCAVCGSSHSVQALETTTEASDDRRVDLVCPDCL